MEIFQQIWNWTEKTLAFIVVVVVIVLNEVDLWNHSDEKPCVAVNWSAIRSL